MMSPAEVLKLIFTYDSHSISRALEVELLNQLTDNGLLSGLPKLYSPTWKAIKGLLVVTLNRNQHFSGFPYPG